MNRFIFIMMLLPAGHALAQKPASQMTNADTSQPRVQNILKSQSLWLARAKLSHTTSKGKVYIMPIDNMPCLVPDTRKSAPMPVRPMPNKQMPNPFRTFPEIPKGK